MAHGPKLACQLFLCGPQAKNESDILKIIFKIQKNILQYLKIILNSDFTHKVLWEDGCTHLFTYYPAALSYRIE